WNAAATLSLPEKCMVAGFAGVPDVFPWKSGLSKGIDAKAFNASFFTQPDLFLRLRPGKQAAVLTKLEKAGQSFEQVTDTCIALPNTSKVGDIIALDQEAIVQDYNSQGIGDFMRPVKGNRELMVWDCCAASGGKSILAVDILGPVRLVVSDIRESILANLKKRFQEAGINQYRSFCADLSGQDAIPVTDRYDLVICDVPCTGSGTWGRTPEQLHYFDPVAIERYAARQKKILLNVLAHVRPGGYLLYSTCSVFREENEAVVEFICAQSDLVPEKKEILTGYDRRADTLFGTLLRRPL
ncbi:MAG: Fmu (Sun) domain-containing protein, partial [Chitinophagaceae bacterium]